MQSEYREDEWIRAAQQGHREAFARLYEAHVERVYHYLLSRIGEPADAEDVTAEVFIRAMNALPTYRTRRAPFIAWLFRIAHNQAVNHLKRRTRRAETPLPDTAIASSDTAEAALSLASSREVSRAMRSLTDLQRQVLSLRVAGELAISEVARVMHRSEGAVKALQHSALRALRRMLEQPEAPSNE